MKLSFLLSVLFSTVFCNSATPLTLSEKEEWDTYKIKYGKNYSSEEEEKLRMNIYLDNMKHVESHNNLHENGIKTYRLRINKFADLTSTEFKQMMNGYKGQKNQNGEQYVPPTNQELPPTVDWRKKGAVTGVKNQEQCGSCWAFSTTGSLEGQHFLKTGSLISLSEQNLIDCSRAEGNYGCEGGLMDDAFNYIKKNNGIDTESSYPYTGLDGYKCKYKTSSVGATLSKYVDVPRGNESALQSALANVGPMSVGIDAGHVSFQLYNSGIYFEEGCSSTELDHGVLVVGYGSEDGKDYWLVKNSWGEGWGDQGYIKMSRNRHNNCGIATSASYPVV